MMRTKFRLPVLAAYGLMMVVVAPSAQAQSFFQTLFGQQAPKPAQALPPPMPSYRAPVNVPRSRHVQDEEGEEASRVRHLGGAKVRTVCVRMCDGYYFPISSQTKQSRLTPDSLRCKAACGHEARLFYSTDGGDDPASMVDLTGRRYDAIQNAFAYRKKLTPGCACKPVPWSAEERMRHTRYAIEKLEAIAKAQEAQAAKLAAADGSTTAKSTPSAQKSDGSQSGNTAIETSDGADKTGVSQEVGEVRPSLALPGSQTAATTLAGGEAAEQPMQQREHQAKAEKPAKRTLTRAEPQGPASRRSRQAAAAPAGGGLFNFGKSKYVWPGDPR